MRYTTRKRALAMGLAAAALATLGVLPSGAEAPAATAEPQLAAAAPATSVEPVQVEVPLLGMTVAIDPVTGRLRQPTPAEARELAAAMSQKVGRTGPAQVTHHKSGMLSAVLTVDYLDFSQATLDADGNLVLTCTGDPEAEAHQISGAAEEVK